MFLVECLHNLSNLFSHSVAFKFLDLFEVYLNHLQGKKEVKCKVQKFPPPQIRVTICEKLTPS